MEIISNDRIVIKILINEENGEEKFLKSNDDIPENFHQSVEFNSWESETLNLFEIKNLG